MLDFVRDTGIRNRSDRYQLLLLLGYDEDSAADYLEFSGYSFDSTCNPMDAIESSAMANNNTMIEMAA